MAIQGVGPQGGSGLPKLSSPIPKTIHDSQNAKVEFGRTGRRLTAGCRAALTRAAMAHGEVTSRFPDDAVSQREQRRCPVLKVESWNQPVFMRVKPAFRNWNRTPPFHFQKAHQTPVFIGRFHDSTLNPTPGPNNAPRRPRNLRDRTRKDCRPFRTSSADVRCQTPSAYGQDDKR